MNKYKPNYEKLTQYLTPFKLSITIINQVEKEKPFDETLFNIIWDIVKDKELPTELVSDFYWIITEYIQSYSNHSQFQKDSDWHRESNLQLLDVLSFWEQAQAKKEPVKLSLVAGKKSKSMDHPYLVSMIIDNLKNELIRIDEDDLKPSEFKKEPYKIGAPKISKYLAEVGHMDVERMRAKVIAYLYSIAGIPFLATIGGKRIPVPHNHPEWDEETAIKTVISYLTT